MTPTTADITYRNMAVSQWLDGEIQKRTAKLSTLCPDILSCKVIVEIPHRHHEQGNQFHIRIDITVPGERIVAGDAPSLHVIHIDGEHESRLTKTIVRKDPSLAVRQAFDAAKRQLRDYVRVRRYDVKSHSNGRQPNAPA
jgi:ribosome-associated translation inhibitor RaiA